MAIPDSTWKRFHILLDQGYDVAKASRELKVSESAARIHMKKMKGIINPNPGGYAYAQKRLIDGTVNPKDVRNLSEEASRALKDFAYFQTRYFGRIAAPWQQEAAEQIAAFLESEDEEYVVINCPPGVGKSTTFTFAIPAWITIRNRAIRGLIGSATQRAANTYVDRLRKQLESTTLNKADPREIELGLAVDAVGNLAEDFGRFKPQESGGTWTKESFIVEQLDGGSITEKEPTWSAYGANSGFLGMRYDFVIWDDVVTPGSTATAEKREDQREWWGNIAESRLEPGGLMVLQGQRLGAEDLYRHALDMKAPAEGESLDPDDDSVEWTGRKYHHIVFKAHYDDEDKCSPENHLRTSPPHPEGCVLYPRRLPYKKLREIELNDRNKFRVLYQQEDTDPTSVLVNPLWIQGGMGADGIVYPGCWDNDRDYLEIPKVSGEVISAAMVDPSPTKYWSILWLLHHVETRTTFWMDMIRKKMDSPDFLDEPGHNQFVGIMPEWQERSKLMGHPIQTWIVEANAAQRFMLQTEMVRRFQSKYNVNILPHQTYGSNKNSTEFGVQSIASEFQYSRFRYPGSRMGLGRQKAQWHTYEMTHYPESATDDCVMATWFFFWNLDSLLPRKSHNAKLWRPTWMKTRTA